MKQKFKSVLYSSSWLESEDFKRASWFKTYVKINGKPLLHKRLKFKGKLFQEGFLGFE